MQQNVYELIDNKARQLSFQIYDFDSINHWAEVQRLNYYSLIWIREGSGTAAVDFQSIDYSQNYLFSFTPYQPFLFDAEKNTSGIVIHFHSDFFCIHKHQEEVSCNGVLFNNIYERPYVLVDLIAQNTLTTLIDGIRQDISSGQLAHEESVLSYLKLILIQLSRLKNQQQPRPLLEKVSEEDNSVAQRLKTLIENNYRSMHAPKDYAQALFISPKALGKISKKNFDKTPTELIAERIIIEAKRELYLTSKSIKEIALELGYEDEHYFSRFFKKNTGITLSQFRQKVGSARAEAYS